MDLCERCGEPADEVLPTGELACDECLVDHWDNVLGAEGLDRLEPSSEHPRRW